jgi:hypothetical protein
LSAVFASALSVVGGSATTAFEPTATMPKRNASGI